MGVFKKMSNPKNVWPKLNNVIPVLHFKILIWEKENPTTLHDVLWSSPGQLCKILEVCGKLD